MAPLAGLLRLSPSPSRAVACQKTACNGNASDKCTHTRLAVTFTCAPIFNSRERIVTVRSEDMGHRGGGGLRFPGLTNTFADLSLLCRTPSPTGTCRAGVAVPDSSATPQIDYSWERLATLPRFLSYALVVIGLILVVGNELRAVLATYDLAVGRRAATSVDSAKPDPTNEGKMVHLTGNLTTVKPATDIALGLSGDSALLHRIVEMNQWSKIPRRRSGSPDTISANGFELHWSAVEVDTAVDNAPPEQQNASMALNSQDFFAEGVQLGGFSIGRAEIRLLGPAVPVPSTGQLGDSIALALPGHTPAREGDWIVLSPATSGRIGAYRIRFEEVPLKKVTIVARQWGQNLVPFGVGLKAFLVRDGEQPIESVFDEAETSNRVITWGIRLVGSAIIVFGMLSILRRK